MEKVKTVQYKLIEEYFSYIGCRLDLITAIDSSHSIIFIVVTDNCSFVNLKPKFAPDEINVFFNNVRIKFLKTVANGN